MKDENKHLIVGTVSDHYGIKNLTNSRVCEFSIETKVSGSKFPRFLKVKAWNEAADAAAQVTKGARVKVLGEVQTRSYDKDGGKRYVTETVVNDPAGIVPLQAVETVEKVMGATAQQDDIPF